MCCLFGVLDYNRSLSKRQMNRVLNVLSTACEVRGTDPPASPTITTEN